jgi:hypothetical protein
VLIACSRQLSCWYESTIYRGLRTGSSLHGVNGSFSGVEAKARNCLLAAELLRVTLGVTSDSDVERLLGKGVGRKNEGDTGGRYFADEGHSATLHVVSYTDSVVGELTLRAGVDPAIHAGERKQAESKWFKPADGFGNWHALRLGSSRDEVLKNLGEPKKRIAANDWRYETICECELLECFDVFFKDNTPGKNRILGTRRVTA